MKTVQLFKDVLGRVSSRGVLLGVLGLFLVPCAEATNHFVNIDNVTPLSPYTNWVNAATNIQDAVDKSGANDTVWVGAGRYTVPGTNCVNVNGIYNPAYTNVVNITKCLTLRASNNVPSTDVIIDGGGVNRGISMIIASGSGSQFLIDGFIITNCVATNRGGAVLLGGSLSSVTGIVQNCVIVNNQVTGGGGNDAVGGGLCAFATSPFRYILSNCVFQGNQAVLTPGVTSNTLGGAISMGTTGNGDIIDCLITSNSASEGGGISFRSSSGIQAIRNSVFSSNKTEAHSAGNGGSAIFIYGSKVELWNCLAYYNTSITHGAVRIQSGSTLLLYNSTIASNRAGVSYCGGVSARHNNDTLQVYNSIVYANIGSSLPDINAAAYTTGYTAYTNSCIGTTTGLTNFSNIITSNPLFVSAAAENFRLLQGSPCINQGLNQTWMDGALDLDRKPRKDFASGTVDIGCYEYTRKGTWIMVR